MAAAPSFEKDSQVARLDESTFAADLTRAFCVGEVPNGGYVASIFLRVASAYLSPRNQPDPIAAHWQFLNATHQGRAILVVEDTKPGRGTSVVHVTLYQGELLSQSPWVSPKSKKRAVAYITNSRLAGEEGISIPTGFDVKDPPPPVDLSQLAAGKDANWERLHMPIMDHVPILHNLEFYTPKGCSFRPATYDFWVRMANVEGFTNASLGYISDAGPPLLVETFRPSGPDSVVPEGGFAFNKMFWYPTVTMSLEVKKPLAADGEEWLRMRVAAKVLKNGRYDAEVIVFDRHGEVVALSNHVALAVDIERNYSRKGKL
ncbi:thioesterase-like superfamily-domain-containing protein [Dactylonectria macrodidyma]|uniref:Thioesterase-like superfamily-domain-containing protein n=1 Tax=Dactylonectria macrodidyma TaxID=307937 RepID=A0A9P9FGQ5_9HYPO|nr:thioesterase-like superfamily-domain-containing protein [Dactylonectria macrodidyma]